MPRPVTVTYQVYPDPAATAVAAAQLFAAAAMQAASVRGRARIAISGGTTPKAMFKLLADPGEPFLKEIPWNKLDLFWVDERCVPPTDAESNYRMTRENLLDHVPLPQSQIHRMEAELEPQVAAAKYEAELRTAFKLEGAQTPTFDLVFLGMGDDGHTASLFPHTEGLANLTDLVIANHVPQKDTWRVTLTSPVINGGRRVAFVVEGAAKSELLAAILTGPWQPETYPSQLIRPANGELLLLLDAATASHLPPPSPAHGDTPATGILDLT